MAAPELRIAVKPVVRPLRRDDARGVTTLVADYFAELGTKGSMSIEQMEQLFAKPWLKDGSGLLLEHGTDVAGYGFARPSQWKGVDTVQFGLTLKRGYRSRETYRVLTDPLMGAAMEIAKRRGIDNISIHLRSADTVHPSVLLELGFQEHPVSMLGFSHDLEDIPSRPLPRGFHFRPARLPEENGALLALMGAAFDDRDRQGEPISDTYLEFIAGKFGFKPEQVQLVEDGSSPVGGVIVDAGSNVGAGSYTILEVGVLPGLRRRGIGSALLCRQLEWLKALGASAALAGMFSSNIAATLFWRLGFRPDPLRTFRFFVRDATPLPSPEPVNN